MNRRIRSPRAFGLLLVTWLALAPLAAQPVQVDPAFAPQLAYDLPIISGLDFAPSAGASFIVRGSFTHLNNAPADGLARLLSDGSRDPAFAATLARTVSLTTPLADGRFLAFSTAPRRLERFLADGTPDASYTPVDFSSGDISRFIPQPDGRVLVLGTLTGFGTATGTFSIVRLRTDGTRDPDFTVTPAIYTGMLTEGTLVAQPDGKIIYNLRSVIIPITGPAIVSYRLSRMNADGTFEDGFGTEPAINGGTTITGYGDPFHAIAVLPDGRILAATGVSFLRFTPNGAGDTSFAPSIPGLRRVDQIVALADGRVLMQARVSTAAGTSTLTPTSVFLLDANGTVLRDFRSGLPAGTSIELLAAQPDGRVVLRYGTPAVSSSTQTAVGLVQPVIARFDLTGVRDAGFTPAFVRHSAPLIYKLAVDSAGRLLVSGSFTAVNGQPRRNLARFLADGSLDASFVPWNSPFGHGPLQLVQPDGKVILREAAVSSVNSDGVSLITSSAYRRLQPDGSADPSFNADLVPADSVFHAVDSSGRLFVSGFEPDAQSESNLKLLRLNPDGSRAVTLTTTFARLRDGVIAVYPPPPFPNPITGLVPQLDGKILIAATVRQINGTIATGFARLNADGSTDAAYRPEISPAISEERPTVSLLASGRVLYTAAVPYGAPPATTVRLFADGLRDPSFTPLPGSAVAVASLELSTDKLLSATGGNRWLANGLRDPNYSAPTLTDANGSSGGIAPVVAESAGSIYFGGNFTTINGQARTGLARLVSVETPGFTAQPQSLTIVAGRTAVFQAALGTSAAATYQWTFNGTPISGATSPALILANVRVTQAGAYRLVATTGGQTYTSDAATLTVAPSNSRLANFSARSRVSSDKPPQIGGFVLRGSAPRAVLLRAMGRGLMDLMPAGTTLLPTPVLRLHDVSTTLAEDTGGARSAGIIALAQQVGAFPLPRNSGLFPNTNLGSALSLALPAGVYSAHTFSGDAQPGISLFEFYDAADSSASPAVLNVSLRGQASSGENVLIAGFVITGDGPLTLLIRGIGPGLLPYGVANILADPQLALYRGSTLYAANDNWSSQSDAALVAAAAQSTGAFALSAGSRDAALLVTLEPGAYSVQGSGVAGATGEMMIELYVVE
jgi:uncharacterized delta-60 repeat protein